MLSTINMIFNWKVAFKKWVGQSFNMKIPSYLQHSTCNNWLHICLLFPLLEYGVCLVHTYVASAKHSAWHILHARWVAPGLIVKFTEGTVSIKYDLIESFLQLLSPFYRWRNSCLEVLELSLQSNLMRFKQISLPQNWDINSINVRNLTEYLSPNLQGVWISSFVTSVQPVSEKSLNVCGK